MGDVGNKEDVFRAAQEADIIVHGAALHGIHLSNHTRDDFWHLNVAGTYNIYEAALKYGIKKVLLCSTMGVYGQSVKASENGIAIVTEELPLQPTDFYGMSKQLCENIAQMYNRSHNIQTISYRLGMFVPENFIQYGFRLLKGGVDDRDVAQAFLLGFNNDSITFDAFNIMSEIPFTPEQFTRLKTEPTKIMEDYIPGAGQVLDQLGINVEELLQMWGYTYCSSNKAKKLLGYRPKYNFVEFYTAIKNGNEDHYPYANLPWWGM
jgi:nucleoside-diphosphate-sugar epimerase